VTKIRKRMSLRRLIQVVVASAAAGGPRAEELGKVFRHLTQTGLVKAISVSSWNPEMDEDGATKDTILDLLRSWCPSAVPLTNNIKKGSFQ
jgi:hypothetical protein